MPGALFAVGRPYAEEDLWIRIICRHERVDSHVDLNAGALASFARTILSSPGASLDTERMGTYGENEVYMRSIDLNLEDTDQKISELHALFMAPQQAGRTTRDMFQLIGTVNEPRLLPFLKVMLDLVKSFKFV